MKKTFWTVAIFYGLIAFEFFYMASPFAIYFYSIYKPAIHILNHIPAASLLTGFFLPHVVMATASPLINLSTITGAILAIAGFLGFLIAAGQVYYAKLRKKGTVTGGIYNMIRHPQYASFALCSFGLLLLWPRYLALIMFITLLFAYYFLAKAEERECIAKYGQAYLDYKARTNMFLPFRIPHLLKLPQTKSIRILTFAVIYFLSLTASLGLAKGIQSLSINSLYALYHENSAYVSLIKMQPAEMSQLVTTALSDETVQSRLGKTDGTAPNKFINYILPAQWFVSEIPMNAVESTDNHHHHFLSSANYKGRLYKIVFTEVDAPQGQNPVGKEIFTNAVMRKPVLEVWLDRSQGKVVSIKEPPVQGRYDNMPEPLF